MNADGSRVPLDTEVFKYLVEDGKLLNDHPHVVNFFGSYKLNFKLNAGLSGRTPTTTDIGMHLDYPLDFGGSHIDLIFDVFDLFNQQGELDYEHGFERNGAIDTAAPVLDPADSPHHPEFENADFDKPLVFQTPRQIRFAARSRFQPGRGKRVTMRG